jgi:hypothetical protein
MITSHRSSGWMVPLDQYCRPRRAEELWDWAARLFRWHGRLLRDGLTVSAAAFASVVPSRFGCVFGWELDRELGILVVPVVVEFFALDLLVPSDRLCERVRRLEREAGTLAPARTQRHPRTASASGMGLLEESLARSLLGMTTWHASSRYIVPLDHYRLRTPSWRK